MPPMRRCCDIRNDGGFACVIYNTVAPPNMQSKPLKKKQAEDFIRRAFSSASKGSRRHGGSAIDRKLSYDSTPYNPYIDIGNAHFSRYRGSGRSPLQVGRFVPAHPFHSNSLLSGYYTQRIRSHHIGISYAETCATRKKTAEEGAREAACRWPSDCRTPRVMVVVDIPQSPRREFTAIKLCTTKKNTCAREGAIKVVGSATKHGGRETC